MKSLKLSKPPDDLPAPSSPTTPDKKESKLQFNVNLVNSPGGHKRASSSEPCQNNDNDLMGLNNIEAANHSLLTPRAISHQAFTNPLPDYAMMKQSIEIETHKV